MLVFKPGKNIVILGIVHIANHLAHLDTLVFLVFPLCDLGVNGAILIIGDHNSKRIRGKRLIRQAGSGICRAFCHQLPVLIFHPVVKIRVQFFKIIQKCRLIFPQHFFDFFCRILPVFLAVLRIIEKIPGSYEFLHETAGTDS